MNKKRAHPLAIVGHIWQFLFILIIPALKALITSFNGDILPWVSGAWFDILLLLATFSLGFLRWFRSYYYLNDDSIIFCDGLVLTRSRHFKLDKICTLSLQTGFYLKPFGAALLSFDTLAGSSRSYDFSMLLRNDDAKQLLQRFEQPRPPAAAPPQTSAYHPPSIYISMLSALLSNSFAGIVLVSTFISQSGKILGNEFSSRLTSSIESLAHAVSFGLPPLAAYISLAIAGGWLIAFAANMLRLRNFKVLRFGGHLRISSGLLTARFYSVAESNLNYYDISSGLFTRLFRLNALFVSAAGFGKGKGDASALFPACTRCELRRALNLILPSLPLRRRELKPDGSALFRYISEPVMLFAALAAGSALAWRFLEGWHSMIAFLGTLGAIAAGWLLAVRIIDFLSCGIAFSDGFVIIRYSALYSLHTVIAPNSSIIKVQVKSSPIQALTKRCDLIFYTKGEKAAGHRIKNLRADRCKEYLKAHSLV